MHIFHDWEYSYENKKYYDGFGVGVFYRVVVTKKCKKCGKTVVKIKPKTL